MNDELLISYYKGELSDEDAQRVTEWIKADEAHWAYYRSLCRLLEVSYWMDAADTQSAELSSSPSKGMIRSLRMPGRGVWLVLANMAAVVALAFLLRFFWGSMESTPAATLNKVYVPQGQHVELLLSDGSKVWLNSESTLTFPAQFTGKERQVALNGEGFFEVQSDKERPFIVSTSQYSVKAVGTSFNVCAYHDSPAFETALLSGVVEVSSPKSSHSPLVLTPHHRVALCDGKLKVEPMDDSDSFLWREGILSVNESLVEVFNRLQRYYDVEIQVKNKSLLEKQPFCTGKFRLKDGIEHIMKVLKETIHFDYVIDYENKKIVIS